MIKHGEAIMHRRREGIGELGWERGWFREILATQKLQTSMAHRLLPGKFLQSLRVVICILDKP